jgi:amidophosphoribosyltransferase
VKLNLIPALVRGKRVIIVDDSIVRGTTCQRRVTSLKQAGAQAVHVLVSCPPHRFPCGYGIDFPNSKELMANQYPLEAIAQQLNADSVGYLSEAGMVKATGRSADGYCLACFDGKYPVPFNPDLDKSIIENRRRRLQSLGEIIARDEQQMPLIQ